MISERTETPWATTARDLYLVAMAVFLVTIVIGILNGADAVEFERPVRARRRCRAGARAAPRAGPPAR